MKAPRSLVKSQFHASFFVPAKNTAETTQKAAKTDAAAATKNLKTAKTDKNVAETTKKAAKTDAAAATKTAKTAKNVAEPTKKAAKTDTAAASKTAKIATKTV